MEKDKFKQVDTLINQEMPDILSKTSDKLINPFKNLSNPCYKSFEIDNLSEQFNWTTHPLAAKIKKLLNATSSFRSETDVGRFKEARDKNLTEQELLTI